ncbi:MAG TPA: hypothetical protein PKW80_03240 [Bacteroidales bacterium]|nr:hypothetical protein [Bacteroidales bacterium]
MKQILKLNILAVCMIISSCKPSPQKAEKYYDSIIVPLEEVFSKEEKFIALINNEMDKSVNDSTIILTLMDTIPCDTVCQEIETAFSDLQQQIKVSKDKLVSLPDFDKQDDIKKSALAVLDEYSMICLNEYRELISIVKTPENKYSHEDDDRFLEISEKIDSTLQEKISTLINDLKLFAKKYNFKLKKDTIL